jgi:uncharacterized protein (DUF1684 family)
MVNSKSLLNIVFVVVVSTGAAFGQSPAVIQLSDSSTQRYFDEINTWHARRITNLKQPYGWLTLVMREWLDEGKNEFPTIGAFNVEKGKVTGTLLPTLKAVRGNQPFTSGVFFADADTVPAQRTHFGSKAFVVIKRGERYAIRMWDTTAESRTHFTGVQRYPVDARWRIEARWQQYEKIKKIKIATVVPDFVDEGDVPGVAIFSVDGKEYRLEPIAEQGSNDYFFIFGDKTNGKETYGTGRFLYSAQPQNGKIILDFNKAYNPPCAFTLYATCPLPSPGNKLTCRIEAGEKKFGDH